MFRSNKSENENYVVEWIQQNEVNDVFEMTEKSTGIKAHTHYPRTMEMSCDDILEDVTVNDFRDQDGNLPEGQKSNEEPEDLKFKCRECGETVTTDNEDDWVAGLCEWCGCLDRPYADDFGGY